MDPTKQHESVQKYYGETLAKSDDLLTNACKTSGRPHPVLAAALRNVPDEVLLKYYGCGSACPFGIAGCSVLDLGSGSGRDCYAAAQFVGLKGSVLGIDMTPAQLDVAQRNIAPFLEKNPTATRDISFRLGHIEDLKSAGVGDSTIDIVTSNCVLNLCPDKPKVLREVYRVLKNGGEFHFSDVYCDRRLSPEIQKHEVLVGECLGGCLYLADFYRMCRSIGFSDPRVVKTSEVTVDSKDLQAILGPARFDSITFRLFKLNGLEDACEDFGQSARYLGTLPGYPHIYPLDNHHNFEKGRAMLVCGNTAKMVGESWLGKYFRVDGDTSIHFGKFDCGQEESLRLDLVEKDIIAKVSTVLNKMQAEYDERARQAKAANEVDVKNQNDPIAAAEQRLAAASKKASDEATAAASKKASDKATAAAKKKAEVAAGDVAPPKDAHAWDTLGCNGGGTVSGKAYDQKACYLKALEVNDKYANAWGNLGNAGGGTVSGKAYDHKRAI